MRHIVAAGEATVHNTMHEPRTTYAVYVAKPPGMNVFPAQTGHRHLRRLAALRGVAIGAQGGVLALAWFVLGMHLPWLPLLATMAAQALVALLTGLRLSSARPVSNMELFAQLCLDVLALARREFDVPLAAYQVSGEFSLIEAAARAGWVDRDRMILESLTCIRRAGADFILTYFAKDVARWLGE